VVENGLSYIFINTSGHKYTVQSGDYYGDKTVEYEL